MDVILNWLVRLFTLVFCFALLGYIIESIRIYFRKQKGETNSERKTINDYLGSIPEKTIGLLCKIILWIGAINLVLSIVFSEPTIGAYYEKSRYEANYYILRFEDADDLVCLKLKAQIRHEDGEYYLAGIYQGDFLNYDIDPWEPLEIGKKIKCEINNTMYYVELIDQKADD